MSGGGGGGGFPVAPVFTDPVNGQSFGDSTSLNNEIQQRTQQETVASQKATDDANALRTQNEATFQTNLGNAKTQAHTNAAQYFTDNGYDPAKFETEIANAINTASGNVFDPNSAPTTGTAPPAGSFPSIGAAFSPNLGASILQQINSGDQSKAGNALSSIFSPTYAQDNILDSWLAPATTSALSTQFDPLTAQLTNAFKRGTLNDQGYAAAKDRLSQDQTKAGATVNSLGQNILANDRTGVNDYITGAKHDAANVNANTFDNFDAGKYASGASSLVGKDQANFGGDLLNAIGSTSFSDLPTLLNAGGAVQGANDPTATNPTATPGGGGVSDAFIAQQALAKQPRGLGTQGAF